MAIKMTIKMHACYLSFSRMLAVINLEEIHIMLC